MTKHSFIAFIIFGVVLMAGAAASQAQGVDIGKREFVNHCAVCHGTGGKGNGPLAGIIDQKVADLTTLQKNNNGVFPFERTYSVIDGREMLTGHGTRDMPVWGSVYNEEASDWVGLFASRSDAASFVRGRILALIGYISTLQEK